MCPHGLQDRRHLTGSPSGTLSPHGLQQGGRRHKPSSSEGNPTMAPSRYVTPHVAFSRDITSKWTSSRDITSTWPPASCKETPRARDQGT